MRPPHGQQRRLWTAVTLALAVGLLSPRVGASPTQGQALRAPAAERLAPTLTVLAPYVPRRTLDASALEPLELGSGESAGLPGVTGHTWSWAVTRVSTLLAGAKLYAAAPSERHGLATVSIRLNPRWPPGLSLEGAF